MIVVEYAISFIKLRVFHRSREGVRREPCETGSKNENLKEEKRCILEKRKKKKNAKVERGTGEMVKRNELIAITVVRERQWRGPGCDT